MPWWEWVITETTAPLWEWMALIVVVWLGGVSVGYMFGYRSGLLAEVTKVTRTIARRLSDGENIRDYEEGEPPLDGSGPR